MLEVLGLRFEGYRTQGTVLERAKHREEKTLTDNFSTCDEIY